MRHDKYNCNFGCPVEAALEAIGGKWKGLILFHLLDGTKRFNELRKLMPEVTQHMLTKQLRDLENDQIIHRQVYPEIPPKVEYSLTSFGEILTPVLKSLQQWGTLYLDKSTSIRKDLIHSE